MNLIITAMQLSERLEVSERTIYRDIADLQANGVPIDGERGVGYILRSGFDLPPLMFTHEELVSLVAGARFIKAWGGHAMTEAAQEALVKIESVIPESDRDRINRIEIHAPGYQMTERDRNLIDKFEAAISNSNVLDITYSDANEKQSNRSIRPLSLWYWGKVWTVLAWCELRNDFRLFRIDRVARILESGRSFSPEKGKTIQDFQYQMACEGFSAESLKI